MQCTHPIISGIRACIIYVRAAPCTCLLVGARPSHSTYDTTSTSYQYLCLLLSFSLSRMASTVPSLIGLVAKLKKLVHWKEFAIFLPDIDETDIEKVDLENPRNIDLQKQALFSKWLHKCAHPSWEDVISALESTDENMIAQSVSDAFHIVKPATNSEFT